MEQDFLVDPTRKFSGINGIPEKVVPFSIKRPGLPQLPQMELVTNGTRFSKTEIPKRNFSKYFVNHGKCREVKTASLTECAAVQGSKVRFSLQKETVFYLSFGNYLIKPFLHVNHHIQLFRQRLFHRSVKEYAAMPIIGIMGRKSLVLID